jgi:hypothetical protein
VTTDWLTLREAADHSRYSLRTIRTAVALGRSEPGKGLKTLQRGPRAPHRTTRAWVDDWMERHHGHVQDGAA